MYVSQFLWYLQLGILFGCFWDCAQLMGSNNGHLETQMKTRDSDSRRREKWAVDGGTEGDSTSTSED